MSDFENEMRKSDTQNSGVVLTKVGETS